MNHDELRADALAMYTAGACVIPAKPDGEKRPAVRWEKYQGQRPAEDEVRGWFAGEQYDGFGIVCGAISGNLEMFEFEGRAVREGHLDRFTAALADHGMKALMDRIADGYAERTPGGGLHFLFRVDAEPLKSTKLARRPSTPEELAAWKAEQQEGVDAEKDPEKQATRQRALDRITRGEQVPQVLIETRGEGGFVVVAPSGGRTHPTGRDWVLISGGPDTIATISEDERDALYAVATLLDEMPAPEPPRPPRGAPAGARDDDDELRPGDDFNLRADWDDILTPHGWTHARNFGNARAWRRPGKNLGISATTGHNDGDNLYVFTTSTLFDDKTPYSKFAAYALLEHGGDYAAAARDLRRQGYGGEREHDDENIGDLIVGGAEYGVDGNLATVTPLRPNAEPGPEAAAPPQPEPRLHVVNERTHRYSDDRNALALVQRFGDRIRYCPDRSSWLTWDGQRWRWCETGGGVVAELAKRVARSLPEETKVDQKYKQTSLSARGINACLALARTDERVVVSYRELDARPWELNTPGGIVDLRTGTLMPPDPARLHTRLAAVTPDFTADAGRWEEFLADTFGDDQELIAYMQRLVGYSAVGMVGPHILPFAFGSGGNGKGAFLESITAVLGDYAGKAPRGFLTVKTFDPHPQEIAKLAGLRMVIASETNESDKFDESKVKELTGGDTLTGHFMRENDFSFTPTHHLWLMGNTKPGVETGGRSFWRRLRLIPFTREVPEDKVVDDLQGILARDHGPALLAWIARGAAAYAAGGLADPKSVTDATAEYERDQDTVKRFVEENCRVGGGRNVTTKVKVLRDAYEKFCQTEGTHAVTATAFTLKLAHLDVGRDRVGKARDRVYTNIALLSEESDDAREWFR